jgi:carotenoid cleavage dioxygenase-like enzyme
MTLPTRYLYTMFTDDDRPVDRAKMLPGAPARLTNSYGRFDIESGKVERYFAGATHNLQECTFVPKGMGVEGEGYLIGVATNYAENRAELVIADASRLGEGDIARVILPFRISPQVHGVWASAKELPLV